VVAEAEIDGVADAVLIIHAVPALVGPASHVTIRMASIPRLWITAIAQP
jgi:hypothetical protein